MKPVRVDSQGLPDFCEVLECVWTVTGGTRKYGWLFNRKLSSSLIQVTKKGRFVFIKIEPVNSLIEEALIESKWAQQREFMRVRQWCSLHTDTNICAFALFH